MTDSHPLSINDQILEPLLVEHGYGTRFLGFQNLMRRRIRNILLVCSLYDLYIFEEDGRLYELLRNEYQNHRLSHTPEIIRVSSGAEALNTLGDTPIHVIVSAQDLPGKEKPFVCLETFAVDLSMPHRSLDSSRNKDKLCSCFRSG